MLNPKLKPMIKLLARFLVEDHRAGKTVVDKVAPVDTQCAQPRGELRLISTRQTSAPN